MDDAADVTWKQGRRERGSFKNRYESSHHSIRPFHSQLPPSPHFGHFYDGLLADSNRRYLFVSHRVEMKRDPVFSLVIISRKGARRQATPRTALWEAKKLLPHAPQRYQLIIRQRRRRRLTKSCRRGAIRSDQKRPFRERQSASGRPDGRHHLQPRPAPLGTPRRSKSGKEEGERGETLL